MQAMSELILPTRQEFNHRIVELFPKGSLVYNASIDSKGTVVGYMASCESKGFFRTLAVDNIKRGLNTPSWIASETDGGTHKGNWSVSKVRQVQT